MTAAELDKALEQSDRQYRQAAALLGKDNLRRLMTGETDPRHGVARVSAGRAVGRLPVADVLLTR